MKNTIGIIMIIAALVLGYFGYDKLQNAEAGIEIGDLEFSASDKGSKEAAYILLGLGAICLVSGIISISKEKG